jgi:LmbE family N-acetylglucosaminyl deacetylase
MRTPLPNQDRSLIELNSENPYRDFIVNLVQDLAKLRAAPLGGFRPISHPILPDDSPVVLLFSPHPDDECLTGALPLRLLREAQMRVINVPVTLGRHLERRHRRHGELNGACEYLGFNLLPVPADGLDNIMPTDRMQQPEVWQQAVAKIAAMIVSYRPEMVFFPHDTDWHPAHVGTHLLVSDALASLGQDFSCVTIETEYWSHLSEPNLMVESATEDVVDLITALSFHAGEVRRNPYHLSLFAWMMDNVRRGGEVIGGNRGGDAPPFIFATIYKMRRWSARKSTDVLPAGATLSSKSDLKTFFNAMKLR